MKREKNEVVKENKREEIEKQIERRKELIQNMKNDEKIFGLVGEDYAKINKWIKEIVELTTKLNLSSDKGCGK